jgi:hypothetical protein
VNLIDAVKSGKRIRRSSWKSKDYWNPLNFDLEDILATDWEIEERKIEITESELDYIFNSLLPKPSLEKVESMYEIKRRLFNK